jgi:hypothetical protein
MTSLRPCSPEHRRLTWLRKQVRDIEAVCKKERKEAVKTAIGKKELYAVDPRKTAQMNRLRGEGYRGM